MNTLSAVQMQLILRAIHDVVRTLEDMPIQDRTRFNLPRMQLMERWLEEASVAPIAVAPTEPSP